MHKVSSLPTVYDLKLNTATFKDTESKMGMTVIVGLQSTLETQHIYYKTFTCQVLINLMLENKKSALSPSRDQDIFFFIYVEYIS